jgi:hypothetical protein
MKSTFPIMVEFIFIVLLLLPFLAGYIFITTVANYYT